MHVFTIRKGSKLRTIYAPDAAEKKHMRGFIPQLEALLRRQRSKLCLHGFMKGRSPVTNAQAHVGRLHTLTMDLSGFFDSVTHAHLERVGVHDTTKWHITINGVLRQGLPSSPAAANLAAVPLDKAILRWISERRDRSAVYTRYADDLTLSSDDKRTIEAARAEWPAIVEAEGFTVSERKTRVYHASGGRRMVTGVAVDGSGVHPTRAAKRRLRAALHQGNEPQARGLAEWCKLKLPRAGRVAHGKRQVVHRRSQGAASVAAPATSPRRIVVRRKTE